MLRYVNVDINNYEDYKKYIVANEKFFNPKIRTPKEVYHDIINDPSQITILLFNPKFVGYIIGYKKPKGVFYIFSILVTPKNREKGYGRKLLNQLVKIVKKKGYLTIEGHFNHKSVGLLKGHYPELIKTKKKWEGTTEDYKLMRIRI